MGGFCRPMHARIGLYKILPKCSNPRLSYSDLKFEIWGRASTLNNFHGGYISILARVRDHPSPIAPTYQIWAKSTAIRGGVTACSELKVGNVLSVRHPGFGGKLIFKIPQPSEIQMHHQHVKFQRNWTVRGWVIDDYFRLADFCRRYVTLWACTV